MTATSGPVVARRQSEVEALLDEFGIDAADRAAMAEGLARVLDALDGEAGLTQAVRVQLRDRLRSRIASFAAVSADARRHPAIAEVEVGAPVVITGLPRSGTTILHAIMAQDLAARSPLTWELARPSPPPDAATFDGNPRIDAWIEEQTKGPDARLADAEFRRKHMIGATLPEECGPIFATTMRGTEMWSRARVRSYMDWWLGADHRWGYGVHRRWLRHLQWANPRGHWLLKYPMHIFNLPSLVETYPGARLVFTHRDPAEVLSSLASLIETIRRQSFAVVDREALGQEILDFWAIGAQRMVDFRAGNRDLPTADVSYRVAVANPVAMVRGIYARFGLPAGGDTFDRMAAFAAATPQHAQGEHRHDLATYGLDRDQVRRRMADYVAAFGEYF